MAASAEGFKFATCGPWEVTFLVLVSAPSYFQHRTRCGGVAASAWIVGSLGSRDGIFLIKHPVPCLFGPVLDGPHVTSEGMNRSQEGSNVLSEIEIVTICHNMKS